jgi:hypothetical protein
MFKRVLVLVTVSALAVGALGGYAYSRTQSHDLLITANHGGKRLMAMTKTGPLTFTSGTLTQLTADFIQIPANGNYRAVVSFSAESACESGSWCSAVITVDGVEANPKSGTDFAFDSPGGETWQGLTMDRVSDVIAGTGTARNVVVEVQVAVVSGGSWRLDDWAVVTELYKV